MKNINKNNFENELNIDAAFISNLYFEKFKQLPKEITIINGLGSVNKVFKVDFFEKKHIIRLRNDKNAFKEYQKEAFCMEQAQLIGIPAAKVINIDRFNDVPFIIETFLDGINGSLCPEKSELIWNKLGEYARKFHTVPVKGYGLEMNEYGSFQNLFSPTLHKHIKYNLDCICEEDSFIKLGIYEPVKIDFIKNLFSDLFSTDFELGLIHGDISAKNTIVNDDTVYLIDFGCSFVGVLPFDEIIAINDNTEKELSIFLASYGISKEQRTQNLKTYHVLSLLNAFDKLRWAIDKNIDNMDDYILTAKKRTDNLLQYTAV